MGSTFGPADGDRRRLCRLYPLLAGFEEGPVGKFIAEYALRKGMALGFWGMTLCSNCAPHHPFWQDVDWQQRWNRYILDAE